MASLNQLLLSVLRFLSFVSIAALANTRKSASAGNRLQSKHAITAGKSLNAFSSAHGFPCCSILGRTVSSPSALFATVEDNLSAEKFQNSNGQKIDSKLPDTAPLTYSDFHVVTRTQSTDEIKHLELYLKWRKGGTFLYTAFNLR
jgi:hypothetical protein